MALLEQPSQATGVILTFTSGARASVEIGTGDTGQTGILFHIKVIDARFRMGSRLVEITGDGDVQETYLNNLLLQGRFALSGGMIANEAIGLANIVTTAANPAQGVVFNLGANESLGGAWFIEWIDVTWNRKNAFVRVDMTGKTSTTQMTEQTAVVQDTP